MRWPVVAAAMSDPPPAMARNCSSDAVATTTMSRGQSAPQNAVTAATASPMCGRHAVEQEAGWPDRRG